MAVDSKLAEIIAIQIGKIEGELEARIQAETLRMLDKFVNRCPVREDLLKIIKTRNNLLKIINQFDKKLDRFDTIARQLRPPILAVKALIKLLERNPIPSAVIFHPGGTGVSLGRITTLSGRLRSANKFLESLENDVRAINRLVNGVRPSLESIKRALNAVDIKIIACVEQIEDRVVIDEIMKEIQPLDNTGTEGIPEIYHYKGRNEQIYTLQIIEDNSEKTIIPRRVAIAKDTSGVVILKGQPSFSSDVEVLLSELKFRIDNNLP